MDLTKFSWTRQPECFRITAGTVEIVTKPHTDLWQRTYYHFRNDNAPVLQMETDEACFSFTVKTEFARKHRLRLSRQYLQIWNSPNADTLPITGRFSDLLSL